ncbi:MAG: hypothetical protein PHW87_13495 [Methanothrix sp.]|nr:hypothetical protein [Methanothrix sp.]
MIILKTQIRKNLVVRLYKKIIVDAIRMHKLNLIAGNDRRVSLVKSL